MSEYSLDGNGDIVVVDGQPGIEETSYWEAVGPAEAAYMMPGEMTT